ncbi:MAG: hypothetical protein OXI53_07075 [Nitrospira sp.]|nr:hypothetical protein [Nitrospira sp.]MDE0405059.1 hypothetical protein [Nitrospira sp.]
MASITDTFDYFVLTPKKDELPFSPIIRLHLKMWSHDEGNDLPLITPRLINNQEIDYWVDALKRDLDHVGRLAKGALKRANEKFRQRKIDK